MRPIDEDEAKKQIKQMQTLKPSERMLFRMALERTPTYDPPNDPLTPEQLREMDGEPVYLPGGECWVLVTFNGFASIFHWPDGSSCSAADWCYNVGPAYRRNPEEEAP